MELSASLWLLYAIPFILSLAFLIRPKPSTKLRLPPGPLQLPIIGNLYVVGDKPHLSFARLAATYGPVMSLRLGQMTTIVISSPEAAREALHKKDQALCGRAVPDAGRALGHHELSMGWVPAAQPWKNLRLLCSTELFVAHRLDRSQVLRRRKMQELADYVRSHCAEGRAVDIGRAAFMTSLNLVSNTVFSIDTVDASSDAAQEFRDLIWGMMEVTASPNISDYFPVLRALDLQGKRKLLGHYYGKMFDYFDRLIQQRLHANANDGEKVDFLDKLIECHLRGDYDKQIDTDAIKSLLLDLLIGGSETSSDTVEWAMAELMRNPDMMAKARAELEGATASGQELDESDIMKLPYLQAVVKETFRLHAPVPFLLPRKAEATTKLCDYTIPKGTQILVNVWAMGRDAGLWAEPEKFMPERFLESEVEFKGRNFELIPFGAGRRICPGMPLASRMVHLMLFSLLQSFDWKLPDGMAPSDVDLTEKLGLTLVKATPLLVIPVLAQ